MFSLWLLLMLPFECWWKRPFGCLSCTGTEEAFNTPGKISLLTGLVQKAVTEREQRRPERETKELAAEWPHPIKSSTLWSCWHHRASPWWDACRVWSKLCPHCSEMPAWKVEGAINKPFRFFLLNDVEKRVLWHFFPLIELTETTCSAWFWKAVVHEGFWKLFLFAFQCPVVNFVFFYSLCLDTTISELQKPHSEISMALRVA